MLFSLPSIQIDMKQYQTSPLFGTKDCLNLIELFLNNQSMKLYQRQNIETIIDQTQVKQKMMINC